LPCRVLFDPLGKLWHSENKHKKQWLPEFSSIKLASCNRRLIHHDHGS